MKAKFDNLTWEALKNTYYGNFGKITDRMSKVTATFNLSAIDIHEFDLYSRIYVKQLGSMFMLIRVTYSLGKFATVEMYRIQ